MNGNFSSVFKGTGLEFSDLRTYQYGDDVRAIDWVASAKGQGAYVKIFKEEKEQTIFFMLDVSGSQEVGKRGSLKMDVARELCGVLTLAAIKESSQVGVYCFSDEKEAYIPPNSGMKQAYNIVSFHYLGGCRLLISDFLDDNYEQSLKALARKHDLVVLHLYDQREITLPDLGIIPVQDRETGEISWVNSNSASFKRSMREAFEDNRSKLQKFCVQNRANYLDIEAGSDYVSRLIQLFRVRK